MTKSNPGIFSRCAADAFVATMICNIIQRCGCDVFSVFVGKDIDKPYEIWAKYDTSDKLIEVDLKIAAFHQTHKTVRYS